MGKVLKLYNGNILRVENETDRYYITNDSQFKKSNPAIAAVSEEDEPAKKQTKKKSEKMISKTDSDVKGDN